MIPQSEFQEEIADYIKAFITAGAENLEQQAAKCAELITKLARVTQFEKHDG